LAVYLKCKEMHSRNSRKYFIWNTERRRENNFIKYKKIMETKAEKLKKLTENDQVILRDDFVKD
jgi:hypothetical protein